MARKNYAKPFKDEACKLVMEQKQPIASAAKGLGIGEQTLRYWLVQRGWTPEQSALPAELAESDDPRWLNRSSTSSAFNLRATSIDRHSRLYSSIRFSIRSGLPSLVRADTKS